MNVKCNMDDVILQVNIDKSLKEWVSMLVKEYSYPAVKKALDDHYKKLLAESGPIDGFTD